MTFAAAGSSGAITTALGVTGGDPPTLQKAKLYLVAAKSHATMGKYQNPAGNALECQFNPASITITKSVSWHVKTGKDDKGQAVYSDASAVQAGVNAPKLEWKGGAAATFSLDLFFDTTDQDPADSTKRDVRRYTNDLLALTLGEKEGAKLNDPVSVVFVWGNLVLFEAVVNKVAISYLMFDADGMPIRARANVDFVQQDGLYIDSGYLSPQNPTSRTEPRKTWLVEQGHSLHLIAYQEYGHVRHWRHIAENNNILNPLDLQPGQILVLPPLP